MLLQGPPRVHGRACVVVPAAALSENVDVEYSAAAQHSLPSSQTKSTSKAAVPRTVHMLIYNKLSDARLAAPLALLLPVCPIFMLVTPTFKAELAAPACSRAHA